MRTLLQIPLTPTLKKDATQVATELGFSSLQEVVRVFLTKFAAKKVDFQFEEVIHLSAQAEKRYRKMDKDFATGKNVFTAHSVDDLMRQLSAD